MSTIKDIARIAGVNVSTVSRALSGSKGVGEETREKILVIANELGYTPDFSARAMVGKGTRLIGVIVPEISSNYYAQIVNCIENELTALDYSVIIGVTSFDARKEIRCVETLINRKVDGIIFSGMMNSETEVYIQKTDKCKKINFVFLEPFQRINKYDCILIDGDIGIDDAIKHLANLGHREIGFIGEELSSRYRLEPFKKALLKNGLQYNNCYAKSGKERFESGGYLRMKELLEGNEKPTAVFAAYDNMAIGAMKAAKEAGIVIPDHMSIVSYDNIRESAYLDVPLTTIYPPIHKMSLQGVKHLVELIEGKADFDVKLLTMKPELIIRESTCKI